MEEEEEDENEEKDDEDEKEDEGGDEGKLPACSVRIVGVSSLLTVLSERGHGGKCVKRVARHKAGRSVNTRRRRRG